MINTPPAILADLIALGVMFQGGNVFQYQGGIPVQTADAPTYTNLKVGNGTAAAPSIAFASQSGTGFAYVGNLTAYANGVPCAFFLPSGDFHTSQRLGIGGGGAQDTWLNRDAANTLGQRNGLNAQAFNLYNTYTDASNFERGVFDWVVNPGNLTVGTAKSGTGLTRAMYFSIGGINTIFHNSNSFTPNVNGGIQLGASGLGFSQLVLSGTAGNVSAGQVAYGATTTTSVGAAGAASALPTAPTGYLVINVGGTAQRIPYYN